MKSETLRVSLSALVLVLASLLAGPAQAVPTLTNGGFESGFTGWTRADALGSDGTFFVQSGTFSPVSGDLVPAPPVGVNAAMSDAGGPGSHVLYQNFSVAAAAAQFLLKFDLYIGNREPLGMFATPASRTLDFGINAANQQVRVDVLLGTADPFSVSAGDVLANVYQSQLGNTPESGYDSLSFDVTALINAHVGENLRLRFAETDNMAPLQMGVDNVSLDPITNNVPEPASLVLLTLGGLAVSLVTRRRRMIHRVC